MSDLGLAIRVDLADPCHGCGGLCCQHMVRPPFYRIGDPAWARLQSERPDLVEGIEADYLAWPNVEDERPCLWLDRESGRCLHYEYRPEVCQDFEPGEKACDQFRAAYGLPPLLVQLTLP